MAQLFSVRRLAGYILVVIALYHVISSVQLPAMAGLFLPRQIQAAISLACALVAMLLIPSSDKAYDGRSKLEWGWAWVLTIASLVGLWIVIFQYDKVLMYSMMGSLDTYGVVVSLCLIVPMLEVLRRKTGPVLPILILALVALVLFQNYLPGILHGRGYGLDRLLYAAYVGGNGIFGLPLRVASEIIITFIVFGALISASGAGKWILDIAITMTGRQRGGPAKAAVVASAMFGSFSGSPSANAASTGVLTIPLMIRAGYQPKFAAAVEAVASTAGQILPPVMGAIAFVMADWTGHSYAEIVQAAAIPALLYILIVFASVHFQAHRHQIPIMDAASRRRLGDIFREGWFYVIPLIVLCVGLFWYELPAQMAAGISLPVIVAVSFMSRSREDWLTPARIADALVESIHAWKGIAVITAAVGIMVGAMDLSGVGIKISEFVIDISGGSLILTLLMIGIAALILGMGLDAIPAYVTLATLLAPALVNLGVDIVGAHLFVVYWGLASFYTPPLCIALFVTTSISKSNLWESGWEAVRLGLGAFLVPFAFVLEPALLLNGSLGDIALATATALVGAVLLSGGLRGFLVAPLGWLGRVLVGGAGILMIAPGLALPLVGAGIAVAVVLVQKFMPRFPLINLAYQDI